MVRLFFIFCILILLPAALSTDAFEISHETAHDYTLTASGRIMTAVCFALFTFLIPIICSGIFRILFRVLHILDFLIPEALIDFLVPLAVLIIFGIAGGKKIVFGYIEYTGKTSPDPSGGGQKEKASLLLLVMQAFAASTDMFGAGLFALLTEQNGSLRETLSIAGIPSGFLFVVLFAGITSLMTFTFSLTGSLVHIKERNTDVREGMTGMISGAVVILGAILFVFL